MASPRERPQPAGGAVVVVCGRRARQAPNAVAYFALVVGRVAFEPVGRVPAFGRVTPCNVMQLRNAALIAEFPKPPAPPNPVPAGRYLAQAWKAARVAELNPPP